ncbi:MAG TPA: acyltransferase [Candidatus Saccharimonadales bacterium]|nr:acyltransferase [Candidatus Saccharimonadales bacterium]
MPKEFRLAKRTSVHLDAIRGVSALAVMLYHLRGLFFVDFPYIANKSLFISGLYAVTGYGHQAVMIFFVLSGYFIGTSVMEAVGAQRWYWRTYLVSRFTRLQLVLFPALVLGGLWDRIGMRIPQATPIYFGALYKFYVPSVALRSAFPIFLGNLFFLQSIVSPVFGSNTPLWSLSYEFWYYILFPVIVLTTARWVGLSSKVLYAAFALLLLWFIGPQTAFYFLIWLGGALLGRIQHSSGFKPKFFGMSLFTGLIFLGALAWLRTHRLSSDLWSDYIIAFCFALWLYALLLGSRDDVSRAYAYGARKLAGFSYTLYLVHLPALILLRALLDPRGDWQPDFLHLAYALGIGLLIMTYSYWVAEFTEGNTATVRRWLLQALSPVQSETQS